MLLTLLTAALLIVALAAWIMQEARERRPKRDLSSDAMPADIFSGIAALAALVTVFYARETVRESRRSRQEASAAHGEEMSREEQLLEATRTAHEQEMAERKRALERDLWVQRLTQLGKVQDLVKETADIARDEIADPPPKIDGGIGTWTRLTGALLRVEAALVILERLGGPTLPEMKRKVKEGRRMNTHPSQIVGDMMDILGRLLDLSVEDESFKEPEADRHR